MARSSFQHHCADQWPSSCHYVDWKHQGKHNYPGYINKCESKPIINQAHSF